MLEKRYGLKNIFRQKKLFICRNEEKQFLNKINQPLSKRIFYIYKGIISNVKDIWRSPVGKKNRPI